MTDNTESEAPELAYPWFVDWAEDWFFPQYARRLASGNREGTHTWCAQWWRHREVAVRMAALWQAWEAARITPDGSAMNGWWLMHADPTMRVLTDAANGPMWRCTPQRHDQVATLPIESVPPGYFPKPPPPDLTANATGTRTAPAPGAASAGGRPNTDTIADLDDGLDI
ncbi:MAG: DUF4913 domain-containing protein [Mycobacteriaceae bacterium]|nr:DUF4913 domain-containing protein [Mycobacteriaceae bacterium]